MLTAALACVGYGAVFLMCGLLFRNPMIPAAVVCVWENLNPFLPSLLKKISVIFYLKNLCPVEVPLPPPFNRDGGGDRPHPRLARRPRTAGGGADPAGLHRVSARRGGDQLRGVIFPAPQERQTVAHGASRGSEAQTQPRKGRKNSASETSSAPFRGFPTVHAFPKAHALGYFLTPYRAPCPLIEDHGFAGVV